MPGERFERGIQNVYVLGEDEGVILRAVESFSDKDAVSYALHNCINLFTL